MLSSMDDSGVFVTLIDPDWQKCGFQSHFQLPGDSVISKPGFFCLKFQTFLHYFSSFTQSISPDILLDFTNIQQNKLSRREEKC